MHILQRCYGGERSCESLAAEVTCLVCELSCARLLSSAFLFKPGKQARSHLTTQQEQLPDHVPISLECLKDAQLIAVLLRVGI